MRQMLIAGLMGASLTQLPSLAAQDGLWFVPGQSQLSADASADVSTGPARSSPTQANSTAAETLNQKPLWFAPGRIPPAETRQPTPPTDKSSLWFTPQHASEPTSTAAVDEGRPPAHKNLQATQAATKLQTANRVPLKPLANAATEQTPFWLHCNGGSSVSTGLWTSKRPAGATSDQHSSAGQQPSPVAPTATASTPSRVPAVAPAAPNLSRDNASTADYFASESLIPEMSEFRWTDRGVAVAGLAPAEPESSVRGAQATGQSKETQLSPSDKTQLRLSDETQLSLSDGTAAASNSAGDPAAFSPGVYYTLADNLFATQESVPQPSASDRASDGYLSTQDMIGPLRSATSIFGDLHIDDDLRQQASLIVTGPRPDNQNFSWMPAAYTWISPVFYHHPLYFEQPNLERYGLGRARILQPVASSVHFFGSIPLIPYKTLTHHPRERVYTLGNGRPGNCVPIQRGVLLGQSRVGEVLMFWEDCSGYGDTSAATR